MQAPVVMWIDVPQFEHELARWTENSYISPLRDWRESPHREAMEAWAARPESGPTFTLYRGINLHTPEILPDLELTSWTTSVEEAQCWGPVVRSRLVPRSRVLAAFRIYDIVEFIVYTPDAAVRFDN